MARGWGLPSPPIRLMASCLDFAFFRAVELLELLLEGNVFRDLTGEGRKGLNSDISPFPHFLQCLT